MKRFVVALCLVGIAGSAGSMAAAARGESPTDVIRRTNERINGLLRKQTKANTKRIEGELSDVVAHFLDFPELARLSLSKHWEERTPAERKEFTNILRQLIEKNYLKQIRSNLKYSVKYVSEEVDGDKARVDTVINVKRNRRAEKLKISYSMRKAKLGWMVYDVITDDVSILRNYRSQFNRIIRRDSYQKLVEKMRRKLDTI